MEPASRSNGQRPRRPRAARACDLCRAKKNKCDESYPCSYCKNRQLTCVYQGQQPNSRRYTAEYVKQLEEQVKLLSTRSVASPSAPPMVQVGQSPSAPHIQPQHFNVMAQEETPVPIRETGEEEISGVNRHTRDVEFYGSSSSFALLSHIRRTGQRRQDDEDGAQLVSSLHNPAFRTTPTASHGDGMETGVDCANHYPQCRGFVESFFSTIHYIHPILDKRDFLQQCEALWSRSSDHAAHHPTSSFVALYYSVLALGAIVAVREEESIDGLSNLQWSRKFFDIARTCCNQLGLVTDLEMVQCFFMMAKVCQNELNPHWSYMYVGLAVRTALAMGVNRDPGSNTRKSPAQLKAESRTWWGIFSLEMEISFSLGRPDTLGADIYHNRRLPLVRTDTETERTDSEMSEPPHCAIINYAVDLARITRTICQKIYLPNPSIADMIILTNQIERELEMWVESLPSAIRPDTQIQFHQKPSLRSARDAQWAKRQRLVLNIRYNNLRILLFGSLLLRSSQSERATIPGCMENTHKCLDSAKQTISIIYQTYAHNDFFQTWFYNITYTVFAASVILLYITQGSASHEEAQSLFELVNMAVEILETMEECVVALEAARLLRSAREKAESRLSSETAAAYNQEQPIGHASSEPTPLFTHVEGHSVQLNHYWGPLGLIDGSGMDFDIAAQLGAFDQNNPMFFSLGEL
ncbi:uncharacterized protein CC84DRAFT_123194 [Paraphaeosphaeria sporulosa]|uniref:Zn(2)-C6 fungal-type domain-containing protein n=1 Tax=Paraphaeosphaeria sporulosa TaxID=1460663 RepID=A0A177CZP5_9PLEO|nr:uncharacterized protein CC84DRAFT_123194 [Paraphaeosphaeria sporulosa]OAG12437.1 hypothetical protein CC84DRAFT_123194 [Paraphaeosphaeria sporulosa]